MSRTLLTGEKKIRDTMTSLLLSERALSDWGLYPELAAMVDRRGTSAENALKGDSPVNSPTPNWDPALCKSNHWRSKCPPSPDGRQGATSYGLMGPGPLSTLYFLALMLRSLVVAIMAEKQKVIFLLDSGAHFSVLPFSPDPQSNDKSYCSGQIWLAPRALVYPASGLVLGRPPLLSFFPHSS
jgi:hypothetical protein